MPIRLSWQQLWFATALVCALSVGGVSLLWILDSGDPCANRAGGELPPTLTLTLVWDGTPDSVILEWTGGPANVTSWQYQLGQWGPVGIRGWMDGPANVTSWSNWFGPWELMVLSPGLWRDIPDSGPDTRSYRLSGLPPVPARSGLIWSRTSQYLQVRPVMGPNTGQASNWAEWVRVWPPRATVSVWPTLVQGDGHTEWYSPTDLVLTIPAGLRLQGEHWVSVCSAQVSCRDDEELRLTDVASGSLLVLDGRTGEERKRTIEGGDDACVEALFDDIVASVRTITRRPSNE